MGVVKADDIRDQVDALLSRVEAGETILIEKNGKTVARLVGVPFVDEPETVKKVDWEALKRFTDSQPMQTESAGDFMRRMRDDARY